jgi:hypothetical protein
MVLRPQLVMLCQYEAILTKHNVVEMPLSIKTLNGGTIQNPDLLMYDRLLCRAQTLWRQLGLAVMFLNDSAPVIDAVTEAEVDDRRSNVIMIHAVGRGMPELPSPQA